MKDNKNYKPTLAGYLLLLGFIIGIFSVVPVLEKPVLIAEIQANKNQVLSGALFQTLLVPIHLGFAFVFFPLLYALNKTFSLGFIGFRFMSATFQLIGALLLPVLVNINQTPINAASTELSHFGNTLELLLLLRNLINHFGVILTIAMGNLLFLNILHAFKIIPKWLSVWGFIGNALLILACGLMLMQKIEVVSISYALLTIPIVIQELSLGLWLIIKKWNVPSATNQV